jgi:hypothetical protein
MRDRRSAHAVHLFAVAALLSADLVTPAAAETVKDALTQGTVDVDLRYRYEFVDQDSPGTPEDAKASTLRLRLGYTTGLYYGLFAMAELEGIWVIGSEQYKSTANGLTQYPVVADPEGEELNQGFLGYRPLDTMTFKLGRQRIKLDNDRFIGNVGWRQNEQTYDAFSGWFDCSDEFALFAGFIGNTNRVFGEDHPDLGRAELNLDAPVLNISCVLPLGKLTGYGDFLEFVELGVGIEAVTLKAGYELLGGDGVYAFETPLATGHSFNGWADQFLVTPLAGQEDIHVSAAATLKRIDLLGVYHSFAPDTGSGDYGMELDLQITRGFGKMYSVGAKYAGYSADSGTPTIAFPGSVLANVDVEKIWVWLGPAF